MRSKSDIGSSNYRISEPTRAALVVAVAYAVIAGLYILFSDRLVDMLVSGDRYNTVQTFKGVMFVAITAVLLFLVVRRRTRMIQQRTSDLLAAIHSSPLPIYTLCRDGSVRLWSVAAERVLGWTAQQVLGEIDPMNVMFGDEQATKRLAAVRAGRRIVGTEIVRRQHDGQKRIYSMCASRLNSSEFGPADDVGEVIVILQDVTDTRHRQAMDGHRNDLTESMGDFDEAVGMIGHELRTPLASMRASAELLLSEALGDPEEQRRLLQMVHDQIGRMTEMTSNMLESARLNSGRARWNWQTVPLEDICQEAIEILTPLIDPKRVQLSFDVDPQDLTMQSDSDAIRRLILNLAGNAAKFTSDGEIQIRLRPQSLNSRRWIELVVSDTGFGMDEQELRRIGEAFASNEGGMNESPTRGAGLGLSICCRIVAAHDGRMVVASKPHEGTRVVTRLAADLAGPVDTVDPGSIMCEIKM
jgi:PAS domain S-box-containing protein